MTQKKYKALVRFATPDGGPGYIEPGETMPDLPEESIALHLANGTVELVGKPDPPKPDLPTIEETLGKKMAEALCRAGFVSWLEIGFATDEQLMSVEGMGEATMKKISNMRKER